jgi:hypothetical protein
MVVDPVSSYRYITRKRGARRGSPDLLQRLLAEVLDPEHLFLGLLHQVAERADVLLLERVPRPHGQLREVVDRLLEEVLEPLGHRDRPGGATSGRPPSPKYSMYSKCFRTSSAAYFTASSGVTEPSVSISW